MIPIPKPRFFDRKVPANQSVYGFFEEINYRQAHVLGDAINRVRFS